MALRLGRPLTAGLLSALLAAAAAAHDTWLLPERFVLPGTKTIFCEMTSGMAFPRLDSAIDRARVERAELRLAGVTQALDRRRTESHALAFLVPLRASGVATLTVTLKPRTLELTPQQVAEYLVEIGAAEGVRHAWEASGGKRWSETYTKHAKTFVRVGDSVDGSWAEPVGLALEIVPEADPTALVPGESLTVRLLRGGKPASGSAIGLLRGGEATGILRVADGDGRATFPIEKRGRYLVRATELRPSPEGVAGESWLSDFTTLTLEAR